MNTLSAWVNKVGGVTVAAELLEVSPDAVRKWMRGDRCPRPKMAAKIEQISLGDVPRSTLLWPEIPAYNRRATDAAPSDQAA